MTGAGKKKKVYKKQIFVNSDNVASSAKTSSHDCRVAVCVETRSVGFWKYTLTRYNASHTRAKCDEVFLLRQESRAHTAVAPVRRNSPGLLLRQASPTLANGRHYHGRRSLVYHAHRGGTDCSWLGEGALPPLLTNYRLWRLLNIVLAQL